MSVSDNFSQIKSTDSNSPLPKPPEEVEKGGHKWKNIGNKVKNAFAGVKDTFKNLSQKEKDCLMAAAAVVAIVAIIIAVLTLIFGFGAFGAIFLGIAPLFFASSIPIMMFRKERAKHRVDPTKTEIAQHQERAKKIEVTREAERVHRAKLREKWLTKSPV